MSPKKSTITTHKSKKPELVAIPQEPNQAAAPIAEAPTVTPTPEVSVTEPIPVTPTPEAAATVDSTSKLIAEIHEVAEGLEEIADNSPESALSAPPIEKPVESLSTTPEVPTSTPVASDTPTTANPVSEPKPEIVSTQPTPDIAVPSAAPEATPVNPAPESPQTTGSVEPASIPTLTVKDPEVKKKSWFGFLHRNKPVKVDEPKEQKEMTNPKTKGKLGKWLLWTGIAIVLLLLMVGGVGAAGYVLAKPVIQSGTQAAALGQETYQLLKNQDLVGAEAKLKETKAKILETQQGYQKLAWTGMIPFVSKYQQDGQAGLTAMVAGVEAAEILIQAVTPYADVLGFKGQGSFAGGTVEDRIVKMVETLDKVTPELEKVAQKLTIVEEEVKKIDPNDYPEQIQGNPVRARIIQAEALIEDATLALTDARPIVEVLPQLLGHPEGKKYLILFQNDGELRPTGGFISAFAVLNLDKGRVKAEKSEDIHALDNKFGRNVPPPEIITKYLNEKSWHLRNMNISPDYKVSMSTFKEHYDTLKDEYKVDGIIAIDTEIIKRIVEITGPIEVPGYGNFTTEMDKRCNLTQIVCELEHIIDRPLATLVTNRKSAILGPMMQTLMQRALGGGKEQLAKLVPLMFELLEQKHMLVYFTDEKAQKAAETFNIAGRVVEYDGDYLHVNNANFGGAKSNFYINDEVEQEIEVKEDGTVQKKVTLTYTHTEPMDNCNLEAGQLCLSGIQRNYFRVYVPKGAQLVEGLGSEVKIETKEDLDKTYFDGFFTLRPESRAKVMLTYTLPNKVQKGQEYKLLMQKQPGTKNNKYVIKIAGQEETFELNKDTEKKWTL